MNIHNLAYSGYFFRSSNAVAAGTTAVNGASFDTLAAFGGPYDNVTFIALLGTLTATQVTSLKVQGSDDNATWSDIASSHQGPAADGDGNKLLIVDIFRTKHRYLRPVVTRGTANAAVDGIVGIAYNAHSEPITTQDATVVVPGTGGSGLTGAGVAAVPVNVVRYADYGTA